MKTAKDVIAALDLSAAEAAAPFCLKIGPVGLRVLCPEPLRTELVAYFDEALGEAPDAPTVHILPGQALRPEPDWQDWQRDPGKTGRKDAVADLQDARLIRKVRSGMTFLQSPHHAMAFGPAAENVSTVINFINTQILNACLRAGWQLCHAAAVTDGVRSLAISGLSGGGKSTSVLRLMEDDRLRFVSNDRLLVRAGPPPEALGIPKHPRINPGTILGNPRLWPLIDADRRADLAALPAEALWTLEEKHDLIIREVYGPGRVQYAAPLAAFFVLNWHRDMSGPTVVTDVALADRPDLLAAIMKSPGPFYQHPDGHFQGNGAVPDPAPFLAALRDVRVCEVSGRVDFEALADQARALFDG
ncbi:HPr kinase [Rhodovulum sp. P5]|uniref:HprK-related kinase B n=1 Tax=Rhodovulum sp. P5 TaxID=1564506 RepID=UPI0009C380ED|nr:HprK-related kinase B [Rhodovulum sp. P5]ARE39737.1 HPr kinase [Rhodovulum sp. P5]